jgi:hypothetical protein
MEPQFCAILNYDLGRVLSAVPTSRTKFNKLIHEVQVDLFSDLPETHVL